MINFILKKQKILFANILETIFIQLLLSYGEISSENNRQINF